MTVINLVNEDISPVYSVGALWITFSKNNFSGTFPPQFWGSLSFSLRGIIFDANIGGLHMDEDDIALEIENDEILRDLDEEDAPDDEEELDDEMLEAYLYAFEKDD